MDDKMQMYYQERLQVRRQIKRQQRRRTLAVKGIIAIMALVSILSVSGIIIVRASGNDHAGLNSPSKYYTSICVQKDDTLWSIARQYRPQNCDTVSYVNEIMSINHMTSDKLYAGQHIVIYYLETDFV